MIGNWRMGRSGGNENRLFVGKSLICKLDAGHPGLEVCEMFFPGLMLFSSIRL